QSPVLQSQANVKPEVQASEISPTMGKSIVRSGSLIEPDSQTTQMTEVKAPLLPSSEKPLLERRKEVVEKVVEPKEEKSISDQAATNLSDKPVKQGSNEGAYTRHLMKVSSKHYTLRLTEVANKSAGKAFIAKYKLGSNASYYRVKEEGVDKYVVVYGE